MNVSAQFSPVSPYLPYQAGQGNSGSSENSAKSSGESSTSIQPGNNVPNPGIDPNSDSVANAQNAVNTLLTSQGTGATHPISPSPVPVINSNSGSNDSNSTDPNRSFINNQQANADYLSMVLNLGQGDLAAAAKDYAQLQTDLKLHGSHGSGGGVSGDANGGSDRAAGSVFSVTV